MALMHSYESGAGFVNIPESGSGFVNIPESGYHGAPGVHAGWVNLPESGSTASWDPEFKELCDLGALNPSDPDDLEYLQLEIDAAKAAGSYDPADYLNCAGAASQPLMKSIVPAAGSGLTSLQISGEVKSWLETINQGVMGWFKKPPPAPAGLSEQDAAMFLALSQQKPTMNWPLVIGGAAAVGLVVFLIAKK